MSPLLFPEHSETGTLRKKWKNNLPVALLYPNGYPVAISSLGFQLVYSFLNQQDFLVCERFVYPSVSGPLRSLESGRPLQDFPVICAAVSFEEDFPRLAAMLAAGTGSSPWAVDRSDIIEPGNPLVILGGVGVFMNPEPLAAFADIMIIGEAEPILAQVMTAIDGVLANASRHESTRLKVLDQVKEYPGCYIPRAYQFSYGDDGQVQDITVEHGFPAQVKKVIQSQPPVASHSQQLSPEAELGMYMVELGRGCGRSCRFCAAGFIYRPPRLWNGESIIRAIDERPSQVEKIGLLGMEMAPGDTLQRITAHLQKNNCALSFSSLRADRVVGADDLLNLLAVSGLKSVAIAPDGCSERLRTLINKGLSEEDLVAAAIQLVEVGIFHLKLYVMIGLPTETYEDLEELVALVHRIREAILPIGRRRGRVTELTLSVNSFVPKPWTPFQYCSYGGLSPEQAAEESVRPAVSLLKQKIRWLRKAFAKTANLRLRTDHPERVLQQAVFSRADRRIAPLLLAMGLGQSNFKQAFRTALSGPQPDIASPWAYAVRPRHGQERFCWDVLDHGISSGYLWRDYEKALQGKPTPACQPAICRRCGVCHGSE